MNSSHGWKIMEKIRILYFLLALCSCHVNDKSSLPIADPETQKMDTLKLRNISYLIKNNERYGKIDSLLIIRNGYLVFEEYYNNYKRESLHSIQSVTKSFTSALIGIAVEAGSIKDLDQRIISYFPNKKIENNDYRKMSIRIGNILTMTTGMDYGEGYPGSPHDQLNQLKNGWDTFYLNRPMINAPGKYFNYDSGGVILLSCILKNITEMNAIDYAKKYLFPKLNIKAYDWYNNSEGQTHTGGGLSLRPMDMAKLGITYLNNGKYNDIQIIPTKWIKESFEKRVSFNGSLGPYDIGYGYLWWILKPDSIDSNYIYAAKGYMGQFIFVIPQYKMVVVFTGSEKDNMLMNIPIELLYTKVLPAIIR
jgi:CubicO group peptidase (beta-lactamase class C family)